MPLATLPALFISHGSPMLALDAGAVGAALHRVASNLPKPQAIVVMSAHWQSQHLEVSTGHLPETWHDFRGFPKELYQIRYPAAGAPEIADQIIEQLNHAQLDARPNAIRPRDHGVWMPLLHMYPDADVPVIQISIPLHYSESQLAYIGQILSALRQDQILLIGSGSITHNLAELSWQDPNAATPSWASAFRNWIVHQLSNDDREAVFAWKTNAPHALKNHPTDEHLSPLFFAMGAGERFSVIHSSFAHGSLGMDLYRFD